MNTFKPSRRYPDCLRLCARFSLVLLLSLTPPVLSAPGAHGPNGEHLDIANPSPAGAINPSFEVFTEVFEVVGEVSDAKLTMNIHAFESNTPVEDAVVEAEIQSHTVNAIFDSATGQYVANLSEIPNFSHQAQLRDIQLTIFTDTQADLMSAEFVVPELASPDNNDHHHHFPWWQLILGASLLAAGYAAGRRTHRGKRS